MLQLCWIQIFPPTCIPSEAPDLGISGSGTSIGNGLAADEWFPGWHGGGEGPAACDERGKRLIFGHINPQLFQG
jgi:hypothetical protein